MQPLPKPPIQAAANAAAAAKAAVNDVVAPKCLVAAKPKIAQEKGAELPEEISSIVRKAKEKKGNFGLGEATVDEAMKAGKAWVGKGYRTVNGGKILVSSDGLRAFRLPSFKPKRRTTQANFEWRIINEGKYDGNGHLDIINP